MIRRERMAWSLADRIFYKMLKIPMNGVLDPDVIGSGGVGHRLLRERGRPVRIPGPRARATLLQAPPRQSVKQSKDHAYRMLLPYRRPGRRWRHGADGTGTVTWTRTEAAPTDCPSTCSRATRRSCSSRPAAVHRGLPRRPLRGRPAGPVPDRGGEEMVWQDGPLTRAVREGAICYLDEIVETARTPP